VFGFLLLLVRLRGLAQIILKSMRAYSRVGGKGQMSHLAVTPESKFGYMLETLRISKYRKVKIFDRCRQSAGKTCRLCRGKESSDLLEVVFKHYSFIKWRLNACGCQLVNECMGSSPRHFRHFSRGKQTFTSSTKFVSTLRDYMPSSENFLKKNFRMKI